MGNCCASNQDKIDMASQGRRIRGNDDFTTTSIIDKKFLNKVQRLQDQYSIDSLSSQSDNLSCFEQGYVDDSGIAHSRLSILSQLSDKVGSLTQRDFDQILEYIEKRSEDPFNLDVRTSGPAQKLRTDETKHENFIEDPAKEYKRERDMIKIKIQSWASSESHDTKAKTDNETPNKILKIETKSCKIGGNDDTFFWRTSDIQSEESSKAYQYPKSAKLPRNTWEEVWEEVKQILQ